MFSISSAQVQLLPSGHKVSIVNGLRNAFYSSTTAQKKFREKRANSQTSDIFCVESFKEALRNSTELNSKELNEISTKILSQPSHWNVSHVSANTFFENKNGFPEGGFHPSVSSIEYKFLSPKSIGSGYSNLGFQQARGFKSKSPRTSNPNKIPIGSLNVSSSIADRIFGIGKKEGKLVSEVEKNDKMKALLSDQNLSLDDQHRLKIAFAEGYVAAEPKLKTSSKMKLFNLFRDGLGIVLIIAVLVSFVGGPFRKVLIASTNEVHPEEIDVTFDDVKGVDEAKEELMEVVQFLKDPEKFSALGGKLPKGVLLVGPPGTGKTLLARAVAGEANVPFFHAAGPEFDEILVGQGARRVRDLFSTAKLRTPCVVFIDEIDSVGAKRSSSVLHPYANQTINQLLSEMDGFKKNEGVIVLGATNRREDLDKALLRPGRFDSEVIVPVPDFDGRIDILKFYLSKIKTAPNVSVEKLSRSITGFTGADIENLVNQAALRASGDGAIAVTMEHLDNARDKVLMGPERKTRIPDEDANEITAYHEGGHALVAMYTKYTSPVHKVTIIPRGLSLGHTAYIPEKENYHVSKAQMLAMLDTLMGGRAAEELIFGSDKVTSGAADDLRKATTIATSMVKEWGMSEKVGLRTFPESKSSLVTVNEIGESTSEVIDSEIKQILNDSYERAKSILKAHKREHKQIAEALLKYETLNSEDLKNIVGDVNE